MSAGRPFDVKRRQCIELLDDAAVEMLRRKTRAERVAMVFDTFFPCHGR
jgi:hypothetical protein